MGMYVSSKRAVVSGGDIYIIIIPMFYFSLYQYHDSYCLKLEMVIYESNVCFV